MGPARTRRFYESIPEVNGNGGTGPQGGVARITPDGTLEAILPVDFCQPAGLTLGPNDTLLLGCSVVFDTAGQPWSSTDANSAAPVSVLLDARTGAVVKRIPGVCGSDEVTFNAGDGHYYLAARDDPFGPVLGVVDAESGKVSQLIPTVGNAHSVAVNPRDNQVFLPLGANNVVPDCLNGCVAVYARSR